MKSKLKILLIITLFFSSIVNCSASTKTYDRNTMPNYGVKKDWKITDSNKQNILKTPAVDAEEKIYDYADILTDEEEQLLKEKIDEFIRKTKMDMVLVIPNFTYTSDSENEDYADDFYDYNEFGMNNDKNSGVLFLRNANPQDPYFNIYTFGEAQLYFDYDRTENILDLIYPDISTKNYLAGFSKFIVEMTKYYNAGPSRKMADYEVDEKGYLYKPYKVPWLGVLVASSLVTIIVLVILINKNKMILLSSSATEYLDRQTFLINERKDRYLTSHTTRYTIQSSSGGFSSSSGSSGGGHSSGGGRHG